MPHLESKTKEIDIDFLTKTKAWENHAFVGYQMPQLLSSLSWALSLHAARICFRALSFAARVRFLAARISLAAFLYTLSFWAASLFSALALVSLLAAASYKSNSYNSGQQNLFHTT